MNENIKNCWNQAANTVVQDGSWNAQVDFLEVFGKLLVAKCITIVENEALQYSEPTWAYEIVNDMREQFGVEP